MRTPWYGSLVFYSYSARCFFESGEGFPVADDELAYLTRSYFVSTFAGVGNTESIAKKLNRLPIKFKEKAELMQVCSSFIKHLMISLAALSMGDYQADGLYQYITTARREPRTP